jgi:hypothetical protein
MAKYIFLKPFSTTVTVGGVVGIRTFSYKVGDIVDATVVTNNRTSEPPSFLVIDGTSGLVKIGFGGRGWNNNKLFEPYSGTSPATSTPKNIIIGVLAIGAVLGLLKWQKVI